MEKGKEENAAVRTADAGYDETDAAVWSDLT